MSEWIHHDAYWSRVKWLWRSTSKWITQMKKYVKLCLYSFSIHQTGQGVRRRRVFHLRCRTQTDPTIELCLQTSPRCLRDQWYTWTNQYKVRLGSKTYSVIVNRTYNIYINVRKRIKRMHHRYNIDSFKRSCVWRCYFLKARKHPNQEWWMISLLSDVLCVCVCHHPRQLNNLIKCFRFHTRFVQPFWGKFP